MLESLITLTKQLINQPSITPNDHNCQNIISNYLQSLQFQVESMSFHDTYNTWAYRNGYKNNAYDNKPRTLLFLGHTDVVHPGNIQDWKYPPFSGSIKNGILYGRGAADMKGALAAMLIATKMFVTKHPNHKERIAFLITSDEEGTGINGTTRVMDTLIARNEYIDYCIVGEPSSSNKIGDVIKNGRRGSSIGKLTIYGQSGHTAYPQFLKNPIHLSIPILSELLNTKWDKKNSTVFPETSIQIVNVYTDYDSKITNNVTPASFVIIFNFRFNEQSSINNIQNTIHKILSTYHHVHYHLTWESISNPYFSNPGKLINIVIDVIKYYQHIIPKLETTGGTSDGRFIAQTGAEVIELGACNHTIHKSNEYIKITDLHLLSLIYFKIMQTILL